MPLRDHFRAPVDQCVTWQEFHGQWPARIVQQLRDRLPTGYVARPNVHPGTNVEIDVATYATEQYQPDSQNNGGGVATAPWAPPVPDLMIETDLSDVDEYEVRIYDAKRGRQLVAAIELVSPANKDRPEHRNLFISKCAALIRQGVAVTIVDVVTIKHFNLYQELLDFFGHRDPAPAAASDIYLATCRWGKKGPKTVLETWSNQLAIGQPLPIVPLWLSETLSIPLELEISYEQTCHDLWLT